MATHEIVVLVCDMCGSENDPETTTHTVAVDGKTVELEACSKCWDKKVVTPLQKVEECGRRLRRRRKAA